jgi:hypothetical protein
MALDERVATALLLSSNIADVRLVGSRARGTATDLSDWDFQVDTDDFSAAAVELPNLVEPLAPVCAQWDRLSDTACYMLLLRGACKVDLIFEEPHEHEPPWVVAPSTIVAIDAHFWDWTLWLAAKQAVGKTELVDREHASIHDHLLAPIGAARQDSLGATVDEYLRVRGELERRFDVSVPRDAQSEVEPIVRRATLGA